MTDKDIELVRYFIDGHANDWGDMSAEAKQALEAFDRLERRVLPESGRKEAPAGKQWEPNRQWYGRRATPTMEIVRSRTIEGEVFFQDYNGDTYRLWIGNDNLPCIELTERNAPLPAAPSLNDAEGEG